VLKSAHSAEAESDKDNQIGAKMVSKQHQQNKSQKKRAVKLA
jgi:hypothetical protein